MRLDLLAILIFSISGLVMAGLQANQHFLLPAMAPGFYNLGQIFGLTVLGPRLGIYGLVYGVILGALLHLGIQLPGLLRYGFRWTPAINLRNPGVRQVLTLMGPRLLTMLCLQSYFLARDRLASYFEEGAVSALNNGWFIQQVPETLIGTAIAIALLPSLSEHFVRGETDDFRLTVNRALRAMLALTLPIAALLAVSIRPLVRIAFDFGPRETELMVWATRAFLLGLMGHTWLEVGVRSFYARQNARTPLLAAFLQAVAYILLALWLSRTVGHTGLALADTFSFTGQALLLLFLLNRVYPGVLQVSSTLARALLGALVGGGLAYLLLRFLPLPLLPLSLGALAAGGLAALPFIWTEIKLLVRL
jgi:putative peptidoglycan lipid II flippase